MVLSPSNDKNKCYQYSIQHRDARSQHIPRINKQEHIELHPKVFYYCRKNSSQRDNSLHDASTTILARDQDD